MTAEPRLILDLSDVLAIRIDCRKCNAAVVLQPKDWNDAPFQCPGCGNTWELPRMADSGFTPINYFGLGLRRLLEQITPSKAANSTSATLSPTPTLPYRVRIEIKDPLAGTSK